MAMTRRGRWAIVAVALSVVACGRSAPAGSAPDGGAAVAAFDVLPNGGRIELQRGADEPEEHARRIRDRLRSLVLALRTGDFSTPAFAHMSAVPGATTMAERHDMIRYLYRELPRGAEVRITTNDRIALRAVQDFVTFQRMEHAAGRDLP